MGAGVSPDFFQMTWFNDRHRKKPKNGRAEESIQERVDSFQDGFSAAYREAMEWCLGKTQEEIQAEYRRRYEGQD